MKSGITQVMFLALFVKKDIFRLLDLEIDLSNLEMTCSHENNKRNVSPGQNQIKMRYWFKNHI